MISCRLQPIVPSRCVATISECQPQAIGTRPKRNGPRMSEVMATMASDSAGKGRSSASRPDGPPRRGPADERRRPSVFVPGTAPIDPEINRLAGKFLSRCNLHARRIASVTCRPSSDEASKGTSTPVNKPPLGVRPKKVQVGSPPTGRPNLGYR